MTIIADTTAPCPVTGCTGTRPHTTHAAYAAEGHAWDVNVTRYDPADAPFELEPHDLEWALSAHSGDTLTADDADRFAAALQTAAATLRAVRA